MEEIGRKLRVARERLGLTLAEVERATRIRTRHLKSLERGELEALPSPVQARGFLKNYAEFLGLDADEILLQYAQRLRTRRPRKSPGVVRDDTGGSSSVQVRTRRLRWLSSDLLTAASLTLAVIAVLIWGGNRLLAAMQREAEPTQAPAVIALPSLSPSPQAASPAVDAAPPSAPLPVETETPAPTQPILLGLTDSVTIKIEVEKHAWAQVLVDGQEAFRGRLEPGDILEFEGDQRVEVTTGNGAGLHVYFNEQDQGILGGVGQVVTRLWTLEGALTPTPTLTRTPTETPPATATATPTTAPNGTR